jgi:hypothetical protein
LDQDTKQRNELFWGQIDEQRRAKSGLEAYLEDVISHQGVYYIDQDTQIDMILTIIF